MGQIDTLLETMQITRADHLPIVAAFCGRIDLIGSVNRVVPTDMEVDVGTIIQGMVLDTLSGRSPLYRLQSFFRHQDTELLLGREVNATAFNDTTVGRAMDAVFDAGAEKVFSHVAFQAARRFPLDLHHVHYDTTSVNVWGDYEACGADSDRLKVTYGKSKDHRPDLKQFLIETLCVSRNVPILGACKDGNASDKTLNNALLTRISRHMAKYGVGEGEFLYVADCAMVTEDNLASIGNNRFVTRLPFSYNEADRVVSEAVANSDWEHLDPMSETPASAKRPSAIYRIAENTVTLYGKQYRAIVVHSSAHDKRRLKRLDRHLRDSQQQLNKILAEETTREYFCCADADAAATRLASAGTTDLHRIEAKPVEKIRYAPGRPPKNGPRKIASVRYVLDACIQDRPDRIQRKRDEAGCFVLLTNVPTHGDTAQTGAQLLRAYKDQYGVERNYSFLKDPLIVNDLFLKKPERIQVLGTVLLIALLVWNLIEHELRQHLADNNDLIPGWDNKPTKRPTAFMMSTKFAGIQIIKVGNTRRFAQPLTSVHKKYLEALKLTEQSLLSPHAAPD